MRLNEEEKEELKVIYNINYLENWIIRWLWEYMLKKFFKEYTKFKKIEICDILLGTENFYGTVLRRLKNQWVIKSYKFYREKFFGIFEIWYKNILVKK